MNVTRVNAISRVSLRGQIIDSHAHVGTHNGKIMTKSDLDIFVRSKLPNNDNVEKIFVSNIDVIHGVSDEYLVNNDTIEMFKNDSKYELFASCNPRSGSISNIQKLYRENKGKFIGLKFHPLMQKLELTDARYEPYFNFAQKYKIPCLLHSEVNVDDKEGKLLREINKYSDPELIYNVAKKYKKIPFVMAHLGAGWNEAHDKAIDVMVQSIIHGDADLYADISWVDIDSGNKNHIIRAIKELKGIGKNDWKYGDQSYRLLFGTDAPIARFKEKTESESINNYNKFVEEIKIAIRNDPDLKKDSEKVIEDLFYNNAKKLYLDRANLYPVTKKKGKLVLISGIIISLLASSGLVFVQNNNIAEQNIENVIK